jgi:predicted dehydrogenase
MGVKIMIFYIIGLGSMGKRRVRNLLSLGISKEKIFGHDPREDRQNETKQKYDINLLSEFNDIFQFKEKTVFIISTPPDQHMHYANIAHKNNIDAFIEASVTHSNEIFKLHDLIQKNQNCIILPSNTMYFSQLSQLLNKLLDSNKIGNILNINYHTGQYLPDWHPWENIKDYYVSNKETGGAREIVPFELAWLNKIFGYPRIINAFKNKLSNMDADIDDIYHVLLQYPKGTILNLTIEVLSLPKATRTLNIIGDQGRIFFNGNDKYIQYATKNSDNWEKILFEEQNVETGYINPEEPYIEELKSFINSITSRDITIYPLSLYDDYMTLQLLENIEKECK